MADPKLARGYRNRNPGNIDYLARRPWAGQVSRETRPDGTPGRFGVYRSHELGIRAIVMQVRAYGARHGLRTVSGIINRWAPGNENNTSAYVTHVANYMRVTPGTILDLDDDAQMTRLVEAIIIKELGGNPYDPATIEAGIALARNASPDGAVTTITAAAGTMTGQAATRGVTLTAAAGMAAPVLTAAGGLDWRVGVALVLMAGAAALAWVLAQRREA